MTREKLTIREVTGRRQIKTFAEDVQTGLTTRPKSLPPKYFYDTIGSALFEVITLLPEYYPTRAEAEILEKFADEIVAGLGAGKLRLLELGSGSATKTRFIIEAILRRQETLTFVPIDISPSALEESSQILLKTYPNLSIEAFAGDYLTVLREANFSFGEERTLALFLGSTIGNFTYEQARDFMLTLRRALKAGDFVLLGTDLKKDARVLVEAYDDATLVTASFNLNLLARLNREFDGDFDLRQFKHQAIYNEAEGRIEMHLESLTAQTVTLKTLDLKVEFAAGETIHTENSYKFNAADLHFLAKESNFKLNQSWFDDSRKFGSNLFQAI